MLLALLLAMAYPEIILDTAAHITSSDGGECSGVVVRARQNTIIVLTAAHCMTSAPESVDIGGNGRALKHFGHISRSETQDLALIEVSDVGSHKAASVASSPIKPGESFVLVGLSYDVNWAVANGFVMASKHYVQYIGFHGYDIPIACMGCDEGDSGAGVFDADGRLAGIYVAHGESRVRNYMVPLEDIRSFLKGSEMMK